MVLQSFTSQRKNTVGMWKLPPWLPPYSADHLLTRTRWTNMCVFNGRNFLKMNESHIIQICIWLFKKYLLCPHILLSFEYSGLLLSSERITWMYSSLSYCCHTRPALKESQRWCPPKANYCLGLVANYVLEIAENTGNLLEEKNPQFLFYNIYLSHFSLTHLFLKNEKTSFYFLLCTSIPSHSFPLAKCRNWGNREDKKRSSYQQGNFK